MTTDKLLEALVNSKLSYDAASRAVTEIGVAPGTYTVPGLDGQQYMVTIYRFNDPDVRGPVRRVT